STISGSASRVRRPTTSLPSEGTEIRISSPMTSRSTYSRSVPRTVRVHVETMRTGPWTGWVSTSPTFGALMSTDAVATDKGYLLCGPAHRRYRGPGGVEAAVPSIIRTRWIRDDVGI